jgi:hypothetical protein
MPWNRQHRIFQSLLSGAAACGDEYRADRLFGPKSDLDALDPIERNFIADAVVEFGGARNFVHRHRLGVFERAAGFEISRDPGCP